jgi:transposase-like protein/IS1 family transposase
MRCPHCLKSAIRWGHDRKGGQRWRCKPCNKTFGEPAERPLGELRLPLERALLCLKLLLEGCTVRGVQRVTGVHRDTVCRLLRRVGEGCAPLLERRVHGVEVSGVQAAVIRGFLAMKETTRARKGLPKGQAGEICAHLALERDTKLLLAWHLGRRSRRDVARFHRKIARAVAGGRFSLQGSPDSGELAAPLASAQSAARSTLTLRSQLRRLGRGTNAFSRDRRSLHAALAFHFAHYNFCRLHGSLRCTPAMAAGVTQRLWSLEELVTRAVREAQGGGAPAAAGDAEENLPGLRCAAEVCYVREHGASPSTGSTVSGDDFRELPAGRLAERKSLILQGLRSRKKIRETNSSPEGP